MNKVIPTKNLIEFYHKGLFPMAESSFSKSVNLYQPKERFLIPINNFHIPKKLFKLFKNTKYTFKINNEFEKVITNCQNAKRKDKGTWINKLILDTYINLHYQNISHSIECYDADKLVGGLYGVHIGGCFFGESMFSNLSNTSKFCLLYLIAILKKNFFSLLDSQFYNEHLIQFGAYEINNAAYLKKLKMNIIHSREFKFIEDFH